MGLEDIELVMDVEDEFGIHISDAVAQELRTVGEMYDVVLPLVLAGGKEKVRTRLDVDTFVWERLCVLAAKLASGTKPPSLSRATRFTEDLGYG